VKSNTIRLSGILLALAGLGFCFWRAKFGIELYDEPYFLLPGLKFFPMGDALFTNEVHNGPRHYDLLNYWLLSGWMPFDVLTLRHAAIGLYALLLAIFTYVSFKNPWGPVAALTFVMCLLVDAFQMPTWSHNWWVRDALIIHQIAWTLIARKTGNAQWMLAALGGAAMGIAVIAYNPLFAGFLLVAFSIAIARWFWPAALDQKSVVAYVAGTSLVLIPHLNYLLWPEVREAWFHSMRVVASLNVYSTVTSSQKLVTTIEYLFLRKEPWIMLGLLVLSSFMPGFRKVWIGIGAIVALYFSRRFFALEHFFLVLATFVSIGFTGGTVILFRGVRHGSPALLAIGGAGVAALGMIGMASSNGVVALFWAVPLLAIPFVAFLERRAPSPGAVCTQAAVSVLMLYVCVGSVRYLLHEDKFDVAPYKCTETLQMAPLKGIRTSHERARLIGDLQKTVENRKFALSIGIPGAFFFGDVRSSINSSAVNPFVFPAELGRESLLDMIRQGRYPEIVIHERVLTWSWGMAPVVRKYDPEDPYILFSECARVRTVYDGVFFGAYEMDRGKVVDCARWAAKGSKHRDEVVRFSSLRTKAGSTSPN